MIGDAGLQSVTLMGHNGLHYGIVKTESAIKKPDSPQKKRQPEISYDSFLFPSVATRPYYEAVMPGDLLEDWLNLRDHALSVTNRKEMIAAAIHAHNFFAMRVFSRFKDDDLTTYQDIDYCNLPESSRYPAIQVKLLRMQQQD